MTNTTVETSVDLADVDTGVAQSKQPSALSEPRMVSSKAMSSPSPLSVATPATSSPSSNASPAGLASASPATSRRASGPLSPAPRSPRSPLTPPAPGSPRSMSRSAMNPPTSGRTRPASALVHSLASLGPNTLPKPRSNSSLHSSRPAPPSPASSRPQSQVLSSPTASFSPNLSPRLSPAPQGLGFSSTSSSASGSGFSGCRERAGSTVSTSSGRGRRRPRSMLGASSVVPGPVLAESSQPTIPASEPSSPRNTVQAGQAMAADEDEGVGATTDEATPPTLEASPEITSFDSSKGAELDAANAQRKASVTITESISAEETGTGSVVIVRRRVVVRDYAFPDDDDRFSGLGKFRPRSNWGEGEPEPTDPPVEEPPASAWGMLGHWGFLGRRAANNEPEEEEDYSLPEPDHDNDNYWSDDNFDDDDDDEEPDGLYRAAYAFDPEGVNEMAIDVGDLLDIRGRGGGGDGWVVAIRLDTSEEGLVPEGYLERASEDEYATEWDKIRATREAVFGKASSLADNDSEDTLLA